MAPTAGLNVAGSLGIWWQLLSLAVAIAPAWLARAGVWTASSWTISYALVGGLVLSRLGLWNFDLCIGQMLQEQVPNKELGTLSSTARTAHISEIFNAGSSNGRAFGQGQNLVCSIGTEALRSCKVWD